MDRLDLGLCWSFFLCVEDLGFLVSLAAAAGVDFFRVPGAGKVTLPLFALGWIREGWGSLRLLLGCTRVANAVHLVATIRILHLPTNAVHVATTVTTTPMPFGWTQCYIWKFAQLSIRARHDVCVRPAVGVFRSVSVCKRAGSPQNLNR